jgi:hypothetical protein
MAAMLKPLLFLAAIGLLLSWCDGKPDCPVDPLTGREVCSKYTDYEAWSRAISHQRMTERKREERR